MRVVVLCVTAALVIVLLHVSKRGPSRAYAQQPSSPASLAGSAGGAGGTRGRVAKPPPSPAAPAPTVQRVAVGLYLHHEMQVDLRANSFLADFYVWFRWKGDIDPTKSFELRNAIEQWQIVKVPAYVDEAGAASPLVLPDGTKYQILRVEARFGRPFSVKQYPLDEQDLPIEVEESKYLSNELAYDLDRAPTGVDRRIEIPGWEVASTNADVDEAFFETNFGDPRVIGHERYSRMHLNVHIVRPIGGMIVKTVVPLAIVIMITFGVFFMGPHLIDARLTLSVTALVSAVALEFSTATELPEVGYLVLLDKVYILSYVIILSTCATSIFAARYAEAEQFSKAMRLDRIAGIVLSAAFFGGTAAILLWR
jgi:hypothetical protein